MGLTQQQVQERIDQGLTNETDLSTDKTTKEIIVSNTFTYFNLIFLIITVLLCLVGSFRNLTFLPIVIGNTLIGIIQEVRAKRTLDKMNLLNAPHAIVVRDGVKQKIETEQLVQDDEIILEAGNQICADAVVVEGSVQVNESLLTGEADEVEKNPGDELFSGSFVVSGRCHAELTHVGNESYIAKLSQEAKTMGSGEQSEMIRSINQIVKWVGIVIIPIGLLLFYQSHFINHETIRRSVTATVAAIIGMIPEGLYLLTTIALALSTMKLASRKVLLHDMKSIEALARVDVLCVDKTGTITEPTMNVKQIICSKNGKNLLHTPEELQELLVDYTLASNDNNATMQALRTFAENDGATPHRMVVERYPFSSTTKYGAIVFTEGTYILGAPEFVLRDAYATVEEEITTFTKDGDRVLLFAKYAGTDLKHGLTEEVIPLGFVILANPIRENAKQTFEYFNNQGVAIKVISGDNPGTVSEVALQAGILGAENYVDATTLDTAAKLRDAVEQYTVFGRVTPKQKQKLVKALQIKGHTVAMTGDGVNDAPALKKAEIGVAMGITGTEVSKDAASMILTDDNFATIIKAVANGRNVYRNIKNAVQFLLSGNMAGIMAVLYTSLAALPVPFQPVHLLFINLLTDSLPAIAIGMEKAEKDLLSEPPRDPKQGILTKELMTALFVQGGLIAVCTMIAFHIGLSTDSATASSMAFATLTLARLFHGFNCRSRHSIFKIGLTSNIYSIGAFFGGVLLLALVIFVPVMRTLFSVSPLNGYQIGMIALLAFIPTVIIQLYKVMKEHVHA